MSRPSTARFGTRLSIVGTARENRHLRVDARGSSAADEFLAGAVLGLSLWLCQHGVDRLSVCAGQHCGTMFLDATTGRVRRFCGKRCATRTHVQKHRARLAHTRSYTPLTEGSRSR
ncbi:hypothetical protein Ais01nite_13850 [Asanoa ishikariensis]|uniref:CGNR zinc finger domain-containing protein n=1 Tax=Asanoa ishikariensis TaxID=137265 RepID=UPI0015A0142A|nr:CGNR zinc finger domain-containing protein [Asanoa ishikariensis]GIF63350.1 hypothetical protein Ais01nite_13850 [Asanoa ishikariensis]